MSDSFTVLARSYAGQLLLLTRRLHGCSPYGLLAGIPVFVVNQVSFVLALMLPLKVIIMLGSDGVPSYFRFFMTEETRDAWMLGLVCAALGMFLLYLATGAWLARLSDRGGERIVAQSRKTGLFDDQDRFASDIFQRVVATWGTVVMAIGGVALGLVLEWRLIALVLGAIVLEFVVFTRYWERFRAPERAEQRERLVSSRKTLVQNLSAINVLLLFGGLVVLLLTDPTMNFIVAVLLFLLARQILARSVRIFADANYFVQNRERVDALVHPGRHLHEKRSSDRESFWRLLMPARRERFFLAVDQAAGTQLAHRDWQWRDTPGKGVALFVSTAAAAQDHEYRLKIKLRQGDAGLARETMFYRSGGIESLGLSCECVDAGSLFGRGYLLLRSGALQACPPEQAREMAFRIRSRLWRHRPKQDLTLPLLRSFPPLDARLAPERLTTVRLACNEQRDHELLDHFLHRLPAINGALRQLPRVLCHPSLTASTILLTGAGDPVVMNWEAISIDVIGADLTPVDLEREFTQDRLLALRHAGHWPGDPEPALALPLVVHVAQTLRLVEQEAYGAALAWLPTLIEAMNQFEEQ